MSSSRTPRGIISGYLDASKTQMTSPRPRQTRSVPRTPESFRGSVRSDDSVLSHNRVASLRKKRRSVSTADEEETPRQLIAQYLATADTTAPLVRHGRRTSQSGVYASQPAMPVSYKRPRQSFPLDDMSIDIESETPRTLINRYLQNASPSVETPVVRHQSSQSQDSPEVNFVQDTYNTPSPFKESSQGSVASSRMSSRPLSSRKVNRSATKSNYSLVIPESQGMMSSPATDKLLQQREFHMPSPFRSSDSEGEEEEVALPDISKFHRTRHAHHGNFNLTVPESMLERHQQREQSFNEGGAEEDADSDDPEGDQREMDSDDTGADQDSDDPRVDQDSDDPGTDHREMEDPLGERYPMYELPMQPVDKSYEDIFTVPDSSIGVADQSRSFHQQIAAFTGEHRDTADRRRPHSFTATASELSLRKSPRRSEPLYRKDSTMDSSLVAGRAYHRGQHEQEHVHSITEQFSPRISSTQRTFQMDRSRDMSVETGRTSPFGAVTPSPVVSPTKSDSSGAPDDTGIGSTSQLFDQNRYDGSPRSHTSMSRSGRRTPNRSVRDKSRTGGITPDRSRATPVTDDRPTDRSRINTPRTDDGTPDRSGRTPVADERPVNRSSMNTPITDRRSDRSRQTPTANDSSVNMSRMNTPRTDGGTPSRSRCTPVADDGSFNRSKMNTPRTDGRSPDRSRHTPTQGDRPFNRSKMSTSKTESRYSDRYTREELMESDQDYEEFEQNDMQNSPIIPDTSARSMKASANVSSRSHLESRSRIETEDMSETSSSRLKTPQRILTPRSSATRASLTRSRSGTPDSANHNQEQQSVKSSGGLRRSRTSRRSTSTTPRSTRSTPGSSNQMAEQKSFRSPVVSGRMSHRANQDLVHTLPNTSANFSPQVASTQNLAAMARAPVHSDEELEPGNEEVEESEEEDREKEEENGEEEEDLEKGNINDNQEEEEEYQDLEDMEIEEDNIDGHASSAPVVVTQKNVVKAPRKPRKKDPYTIPSTVVKKRFNHYADMRVDKEAIKAVMDISEKYWDNVASDLKAYANHAGRKRINTSDIVLLFKRQGHVNEKQSMNSLIERYLPMEEREKLIPCARAYNKIELNRKYIN